VKNYCLHEVSTLLPYKSASTTELANPTKLNNLVRLMLPLISGTSYD